MSDMYNISENATQTIRVFFDKIRSLGLHRDPSRVLFASLYAYSKKSTTRYISILKNDIVELGKYLTTEQINQLVEEYTSVLKFCIDNFGYNRDGIGLTNIIPASLMSLCNQLMSSFFGSKVFLPFAGSCQYAIDNPGSTFEGFEYDPINWALSQIYFDAIGEDVNIVFGADAGRLLLQNNRYDTIFSFPPILSSLKNQEVTDWMSTLVLEHLSSGGEMMLILPESACYSNTGWRAFRETIVKAPQKYSVEVIVLPERFLSFTDIKLSLFLIKNDGKANFKLMDASSEKYFIEGIQKSRHIDVAQIVSDFKGGTSNSLCILKSGDLKNDFNLMPSRYLIDKALPALGKGYCRITLSELIDIISPKRTFRESVPLIGMSELSDKYLNCAIRLSDRMSKQYESYRPLTQECLIAGFIGQRFKVGRFEGSRSVGLRKELFPFTLKGKYKSLLSEEFILRSVMSSLSNLQAQMLAEGSGFKRLSIQDFLSIKVDIPVDGENKFDMQRQLWLVKDDTLVSLTKVEEMAAQQFVQMKKEFMEELRNRKHNLGNLIVPLRNSIKDIDFYLNRDSDIENIRRDLVDELDCAKSIISKMSSLLMHLCDEVVFGEPEAINIDRFLQDYEKLGDIEYVRDLIALEEDFDDENNQLSRCVNIAHTNLEQIVENIISNAKKHGFTVPERTDYQIKVFVNYDSDRNMMKISFRNNGNPLPEGFTKERYSSRVESFGPNAGEGIGGNIVAVNLRHFGGDFEIFNDEEKHVVVNIFLPIA